MHVRGPLLALALTIALPAFAMPQFDGTYVCNYGSVSEKVTFVTENQRLKLSGLNTPAGKEGLPCQNSFKEMESEEGQSIHVSQCDEESVSTVTSFDDGTGLNKRVTRFRISRESDGPILVSVLSMGRQNGQPMRVQFDFICEALN